MTIVMNTRSKPAEKRNSAQRKFWKDFGFVNIAENENFGKSVLKIYAICGNICFEKLRKLSE